MCHRRVFSVATTPVVPLLLLTLTACGSGSAKETAGAEKTSVEAAATPAASAPVADAPVSSDGESTSGGTSLTITNATPANGNGTTQMPPIASLGAFGGGRTFQSLGHAGDMDRYIAIAFDADASVHSVALVWSNNDNSVHVTVGCEKGTKTPCAPDQLRADAKTGAATFTGLVLRGKADTDSSAATATVTGELK
jgi:hypothetical protein